MRQKESISVNDMSRQNNSTCQHWLPHSNVEKDGLFDSSSLGTNSPDTKNFCYKRSDPFLPENRIPLPKFNCHKIASNDYEGFSNDEDHGGIFFYTMPSPTNGRRRNERERQRVRSVNEGFERLRRYLPLGCQCSDGSKCEVITVGRARRCQKRRCSKVDVLRAAIMYIRHLQGLLGEEEPC
ncbi:helix-loop-helix protein 6-like [Cryptotermes secundus]|uniref:helix-loop-helix protein 6-like n=1 Tax=Cryptotermes secundus TaxID=105785 RepID=UPI001454DFDF|nr:helix-loop-helix protein 6-like [Cryptotermes secundus]